MLTRTGPFLADPFFNDPVFGRLLKGLQPERPVEQTFTPLVDIYEDEETVQLHAELPGVKQEDVEVEVEGRVLTLRGKRETRTESKEGGRFTSERSYGSFSRSFRLPPTVDVEAIEAAMEDGVLTLSLPKKEESKARKIAIGLNKPQLEAAA